MIVGSHMIGNVTEFGDEARAMGFGMQGSRAFAIGACGQGDPWTKHDTGEAAAAIGVFDHRSERIISVSDNVHAGNGAQVQVPQHMQKETTEATSSSSGL